ncbi:hypothetical protein GYMLUDRAFT_42181 [Collybiopsis luxurians FD-317 M1]|uniref:N-acetyltransferase domain-containing protein n=1 Tax=Collybiopsis luxurians FD-317 M1 TaxID=944289 RepID=A0A0D0BEL4_9AGAR|nr:hypothetical protein GYMLUDRAFT_42181 [Collybiopsis luxurians FD-317 M1]
MPVSIESLPEISYGVTQNTLDENLDISVYNRASDIPQDVVVALQSNAVRTNVTLPLIEKTRLRENAGDVDFDQLWITCVAIDDEGRRTPELILSCTKNDLGTYPIFISPTIPASHLTEEFVIHRLRLLMVVITAKIPTERVYSIFAPELVAEVFAELWYEMKGVAPYEEPYYAAKLSFCSKKTFRNRQATDMGARGRYILRPAVMSDLRGVAALCFQFAKESEPFVLSEEGALKEAAMLIRNEQVWVHELQANVSSPSLEPQIACLVAFTRNSQTCATISKVVTSPEYRGLGCAQRLVRQVCKSLLNSGKQAVALYVAHDNGPATKVYHNVGFVGLGEADTQPIEGVERWTEIGFDRKKVQLGHW